jgi:glycosyltransferase involved in cell wall biosynthesis
MSACSWTDSRPLLSVVVPVFNEADSVTPLVKEIEEVFASLAAPCEAIIVDDCSKDGSWQRIVALTAERPWLKAIRFRSTRGQTAAMAAGTAAARGELIAFLDGDLQNDPHDLAAMIEPILGGRADVVCGWRAQRQDHPITRTVPSRIANFLIRKSLGLRIHDIGCTLKVLRRAYVDNMVLVGEMHRFIPAYAQAQGARIAEVVVNHRTRQYGHSKYGFGRVGKVLVDLLTVKMLNTYGTSPAYFFGRIALLFFIFGSAAFALVAYRVLILHHLEATPMVFLMLLMFITGLLALMSGLLAEIIVRVLYQVGGRHPYTIAEQAGFGGAERASGQ